MIAPLSPPAAARGFTSHSGTCTVYCNGTRMRAYCRDEVTVVQVTGEIDATNIDRVYDYAHRFVGVASGLILDLGEVDFACARINFALFSLANDCRIAGTQWVVIASPPVKRLLRIGDPNGVLPTANSERQALESITAHQHMKLTAS